jgi:hypothetical protein
VGFPVLAVPPESIVVAVPAVPHELKYVPVTAGDATVLAAVAPDVSLSWK